MKMSRKITVNPYTGETLKEPLIVYEDQPLTPEMFYNLETEKIPDEDMVNSPSHYQSYQKDGIDCITAMQSAFGMTATAHFCLTNAFKYLWRHSSKGGMQDIDKAVWYLNKYKELNIIDLGD
jgi:hypothetical protein